MTSQKVVKTKYKMFLYTLIYLKYIIDKDDFKTKRTIYINSILSTHGRCYKKNAKMTIFHYSLRISP